jgi:hypothetical protein
MRAGRWLLDPDADVFGNAARLQHAHDCPGLRAIGLLLERQRVQRNADAMREPRKLAAVHERGLHVRPAPVWRHGNGVRHDYDGSELRQSARLFLAIVIFIVGD